MILQSGTKVLVFEKDTQLIQVMKESLTTLGAEMIFVENMKEAVEATKIHCFAAMIVDLKIKKHEAISFVLDVRSNKNIILRSTPILVTHCANEDKYQNICKDIGVDEVLAKPFDKSSLVKILIKVLRVDGSVENTTPTLDDKSDYEQFAKVIYKSFLQDLDLNTIEASIDRNLKISPQSPRLQLLKAEVYFKRRKLAEADAIVEKVLMSEKNNIKAIHLKTKIAVAKKDVSEAIYWFERGVELSPLNSKRLLAFGEYYLGFFNYKLAESKFAKVLELDSTNPYAISGLARCMFETGAKDVAESYLEMLPDKGIIASQLNMRGVLLAYCSHEEKARDLYKKALSCSVEPTSSASINYNIALSFYRQLNWSEALKCVNETLRLDSTHSKAKRLLNLVKRQRPPLSTFSAKKPIGEVEETHILALLGCRKPDNGAEAKEENSSLNAYWGSPPKKKVFGQAT